MFQATKKVRANQLSNMSLVGGLKDVRFCEDTVISFSNEHGNQLHSTPVIWHSNGKWTRIEDVFPIENGDIPASYVSLPEGISLPLKVGDLPNRQDLFGGYLKGQVHCWKGFAADSVQGARNFQRFGRNWKFHEASIKNIPPWKLTCPL